MMRSLSLVLPFFALAATLAGCLGGRAPEARGTEVKLTEADFGRTLALKVGQTADIALAANATTGYSWHCTWEPKAALKLVSSPYVAPQNQPGRVGAGGVQHFRLEGLQAGTVTVTLQYGRWWKGGERQPAKTLTLKVGGQG